MVFNSTGDWTLASVIVMGCWLSIIILIGIFGNILVIIVSVQGTRVRTRGKSLIVSMAVADMFESTNMIFMLITVSFYGEWIFGYTMCQIHGFITTQFVIASMYSLMTISVNRYFIVVKPALYKRVFSSRNISIMIALIWIFPFIFAISPLLGWSAYDFQSNKATCIFYFSTSVWFSITILAIAIPLPLGVIIFCCFKIFKQVRLHKSRVDGLGIRTSTVNVEEIKITKTLIIIIMAYLICFIPPGVVNLLEMAFPNYKINFWADIITMNLLLANHANNPVIYGLFNRQYRNAFKDLLLSFLPRTTVRKTSNEQTINDSKV